MGGGGRTDVDASHQPNLAVPLVLAIILDGIPADAPEGDVRTLASTKFNLPSPGDPHERAIAAAVRAPGTSGSASTTCGPPSA